MDHYRASKQHLFRHQQPGDAAILGESLSHWPTQPGVRRIIIPSADGISGLRLPGAHNAWNARVALAAVLAADPSLHTPTLEAAARAFPGLAHRLEFISDARGCLWYNDSKSTTPQSTRLALDAFADTGDRRVHLIVGGYDKKADLTPLAHLAPRCAGLYTIGATGPAIDRLAPNLTTPCGNLATAISTIAQRLRPGDIILLSPGCASWDQFANFEARGHAFASLVRSLS
jgi:UDP-N-acetylmuramoylalanine--D-glutamate ligase